MNKKELLMQTVQFKVDDTYLSVVMTLLKNLKIDMIKDLLIVKEKNNKLSDENKTEDFLALGGSNCWSGNIEELREDRVKHGVSR
jgi:hypothetical protein